MLHGAFAFVVEERGVISALIACSMTLMAVAYWHRLLRRSAGGRSVWLLSSVLASLWIGAGAINLLTLWPGDPSPVLSASESASTVVGGASAVNYFLEFLALLPGLFFVATYISKPPSVAEQYQLLGSHHMEFAAPVTRSRVGLDSEEYYEALGWAQLLAMSPLILLVIAVVGAGIGMWFCGALVMLAGAVLFGRAKRPIVEFNDRGIHVVGPLGKKRTVTDPHAYTLVLGTNFVAFRRSGRRDILLDRCRFSPDDWVMILAKLTKIEFASVDA